MVPNKRATEITVRGIRTSQRSRGGNYTAQAGFCLMAPLLSHKLIMFGSSFAEFVPGEVTEAIVGGVLVHFGKRWVIEDELDERVNGAA